MAEKLSLPSKISQIKVIDVAWVLRFGAAFCVVWCGTGHLRVNSRTDGLRMDISYFANLLRVNS